ncbi:MAG: DUF1501 domain-containing protein [Alphaproteobacteria bacterium]|nr:DUF1501 domain-containing protein [Alphaproteobacteria bacterium]
MGKDQQGTGGTLFFTEMTKVAAEFLKAADGPRICVMDLGNWDSHAGQNDRIEAADDKFQGRFVELYKALDRGVEIVRLGLGPEIWRKTAVVAVTEFGRTVRVNGTLGSDHGTEEPCFSPGARSPAGASSPTGPA